MNAENHWTQLKSGNKTSLEWLYRNFSPSLLKYGYAFTQNHTLVEDCLQDLFIQLWEKREGLGETTSVKNYLFASLRRSIWKRTKKQLRIQNEGQDGILPFEIELNIEDQKIANEEQKEQSARLKRAMEGLSDRQKELLYLKYQEGLTYDEICESMDIHYQSARNLMSSALTKLRKHMILMLFAIILIIT